MSAKPIRETSTHIYYEGRLGEIAVPKPAICGQCGAQIAPTVEAKFAHKRMHEQQAKGFAKMERRP